MSVQHTKGKWNSDGLYVYDEKNNTILKTSGCGYEQSEANALHIVKCVNAHDELVEASKKFVDSFKSLQREKCDVALVMARQAIAKAEGEGL